MIGRQYPRSEEPPLHDFEGCSTSNAAADTGECQVTPCVHSHLGSRVETLSGSGALARPRTRRAYSGGQRAACPQCVGDPISPATVEWWSRLWASR